MTKKNLLPDEGGFPVYRCRLCGGFGFKLSKKISPNTLSLFTTNPPTVIAIEEVPREIIHPCKNGGAGIAMIVGVVPESVINAHRRGLQIEDIEGDEGLDPEGMVN